MYIETDSDGRILSARPDAADGYVECPEITDAEGIIKNGVPLYKVVDGHAVRRSNQEIEADSAKDAADKWEHQPVDEPTLESRVAQCEQEIDLLLSGATE